MTQATAPEGNYSLVSKEDFGALLAEVRQRLAGLVRGPSRYENLAAVARLHQEFGNRLSKLIYDTSLAGKGPKLACAAGCATCCDIPSSAARGKGGTYTMTALDMLSLIEHYPEVKAANSDLPAKTIRRIEEAKATKDMVPCPHLTAVGGCGIYEQRPLSCKIWFSGDLGLCKRNRAQGFSKGVNPLTDESNRILLAFQQPFEQCCREIAPDIEFRGHDFLLSLEEIAKLDSHGLFGTLKEKIDAGEQSTWNPFGEEDGGRG